MSDENRELLEKLKFELAFIEDGGYGRSVRTPHKSTSPSQDSLTCLNCGDPLRPHPCAQCILIRYVRLIWTAELSPLSMPTRRRMPSNGGFTGKSTELRENAFFRTDWESTALFSERFRQAYPLSGLCARPCCSVGD
jgi:hypothetical protein